MPTFDEIFNEKTGIVKNDEGKELGRLKGANENPNAEEANRTNSLSKENIINVLTKTAFYAEQSNFVPAEEN